MAAEPAAAHPATVRFAVDARPGSGQEPTGRRGTPRGVAGAAGIAAIAASSGASFWLVGRAVEGIAGSREAWWVLGRTTGVTSYLLLVALVCAGLVVAHPWRSRLRLPGQVTRIRIHAALAAFTLAFTVMHVVVLATDRYANVGWWGAVLPMASGYRPVAVTLGVVAVYGGLLAGCTALIAGRWLRRAWWPVHKVAATTLILAWAHAVFAGTDTPALRGLYLGSSAVVVLLAGSRYLASPPGRAS